MFSRRPNPRLNRGRVPSGGGAPIVVSPSTGTEGVTLDLDVSGPETVGATSIEVFDDGVSIGTDADGAPWEFSLTTPAPGPHPITVSVDGGAVIGPVTISITATAPTLTEPDGDETITIGATFGFAATTLSNTDGVSFRVTGPSAYDQTFTGVDAGGGTSWTYTWDTTGLTAGEYTVTAIRHTAAPDVSSSGATVDLADAQYSWQIVSGAFAGWRSDLGVSYSAGASLVWTDQVGGSTLSETVTGTAVPTYSASDANWGGLPSVAFDGSNDRLVSNLAASAWNMLHDGTGSTVLLVVRPTSTSGTRVLYGTTTGATSRGHSVLHVPASDRFQARVSDGATTIIAIASGAGAPEGANYAVLFTLSQSATPDADLRYPVNTSVVTGNGTMSASDAANTLRVGADPTPTNFAGFSLVEFVVWPFAMDSTLIAAISAYTVARYGV